MVSLKLEIEANPPPPSAEGSFPFYPELERVRLEKVPPPEILATASEELFTFFNSGEKPQDKTNLLQAAALFYHALVGKSEAGANLYDLIKQAWNVYAWCLARGEGEVCPEPSTEFEASVHEQALLQHLHAVLAPLPLRDDARFTLNETAQFSLPVTAGLLFIMGKISPHWSRWSKVVVAFENTPFKNELWTIMVENEDELAGQVDPSSWQAFWKLTERDVGLDKKAA